MRSFPSKPICTLPYLFWIATLILPVTGRAQQSALQRVDSLRAVWMSPPGSIPDSVRLQAALLVASNYSDINYDSLVQFSRQMEEYGKRTGNRIWLAYANNYLGKYYAINEQYESALGAYLRALRYLDTEKDNIAVTIHLGIGRAYGYLSQTDSCFYYLNRGKDIAIRNNFSLALAHAYTSLGYASSRYKSNYIEALDYYVEALKLKKNPGMRVNDLVAMSDIYKTLGLTTEAKACLREAIQIKNGDNLPGYIIKAYAAFLELRPNTREIDQILEKCRMIADSNNLSFQLDRLYLSAAEVFIDSFQYDKAFPLLTAIRDDEPGKNMTPSRLFDLKRLMAAYYYHKGAYQKSLEISLEVLPEIQRSKSWDVLVYLYNVLSLNYEALGQYQKALYYERKREEVERIVDNRQLVNAALSTYINRITESEKAALQQAKDNAEALTTETKANARLIGGLLSLLSLFLGIAVFVYYRSFHQKKEAAAQLQAANMELDNERNSMRKANEKLRRFSGIVSHDILSNLDLILSTGNVLVGPQPKPERLAQYYDMTQRTSKQLKDYCINLLQETRQTVDKAEQYPPMEALNAVLERYKPALQAGKFSVDVEKLSPTPLPPAAVEQLFQNLISNIVRHAATAHAPMLSIYQKTSDEGNTLSWIVEDNGGGIPADQLESIWEEQPENQQNGKGRHIGLSLTRATLHEYGAEIRAENRPEGGARFVIDFLKKEPSSAETTA